MGLAEKKVIKLLGEDVIPEVKGELKEIIGKDIEISVNWGSFETVAQLDELQHQCFGRIVSGLREVAEDDMGKEALNETLNAISVNNIEDASSKKIELSDDTLTVDAKWEDYSSGIFTDTDYAEQIERAL